MTRWIGNALAATLVGVAVAMLLFELTPMTSNTRLPLFGGYGDTVQIVTWPGFDPWTGEPHGVTYTTTDEAGQTVTHAEPKYAPDGRAIPVPVGFAVGAIVTFGVLSWPRRRTPLRSSLA